MVDGFPIYLTNTYTREREEFVPLAPPRVTMYTCGPTVYNYAHIGNFRSFLTADTLRRVLEYNGYEVVSVRNITDVGHLTNDTLGTGIDRMEKAAREQNRTPWDIAAYFTEAFVRDSERLNLLPPHSMPRATEYVPDMIKLSEQLIDKGYAYASEGSVYYDVGRFPRYGNLSGNTVEQLVAGARVEPGEDKRSPADFALWKATGPETIMQWDSPWGHGVPGWHIECSAMSMHLLGEHIDIHTGGIDNIFPHHEDEIAQSEALTGRQFVRYWVHSAHLQIADEKMAKSTGNIFTVGELEELGIHPLSFRLFTYQAHYRSPLNFSLAALRSAQTALVRLWEQAAEWYQEDDIGVEEAESDEYRQRFIEAVNDDLAMSRALDVVHEVAGSQLPPQTKLATLRDFDNILALDIEAMAQKLSETTTEQMALVDERRQAREDRDWQRSDDLRSQLSQLGLEIKDTPRGQRWVRRDLLPGRSDNVQNNS